GRLYSSACQTREVVPLIDCISVGVSHAAKLRADAKTSGNMARASVGCVGDGSSVLMVNGLEEGRKRVLGIIAGILVARHLKTTEDLHDSRPSPRTESLVASAVQWAERIMRKIDGSVANSADDKRWPRA